MDLDFPRKDGSTLRQHYLQLGRMDLVKAAEPKIPLEGEYLWEWFWDLVSGKAEEGFWVCLRSWSEMTGIRPSVWETRMLATMNMEFQKIMSAKIKEM